MSRTSTGAKRALSMSSVQVSRTGTPACISARGDSTSPFSYTLVLVALKPPGTEPPMSSWCALRVMKATSRS
jgi:hypothetical protein